MISKLKNNKASIFILVSFLVLFFVAMSPLFSKGVIGGDDYRFHLARIHNISEGIKSGDFLVKIHPLYLNGFGYGNGLFYPNLFLYLPAWLMVFGVSLEVSYKIFVALLFTALFFSTYFSAKLIFKDKFSAAVVAVLNFSSQATFTNFYDRFATGEVIASIFLPVIIAALYDIVYENFSKPQLLIIGFLGLVYSHTISLFLSAVICAVYLACHFKKLFLDKEKPKNYGFIAILKIVLCAVIVLLLSISYWLPMLEQFSSGEFQIKKPWTFVGINSLHVKELFLTHRPGVGLVLMLLSIFFLFHPATKKTFYRHFIIIGLILALVMTKIIDWTIFDDTFINKIQFPWRFAPFSAAFLSFGVGGCVKNAKKKKFIQKLSVIVLSILVVLSLNSTLFVEELRTDVPDNISDDYWARGWGEWLPLETNVWILDFQGFVKTSGGERIELTEKNGPTAKFIINEDERENEFFEVPLLYYKGYSALIKTENGETEQLEIVKGENNVVRIVGNDLSGEVCVSYSGTTVQKIAYVINALAIIALIVFSIYLSKTKNHR
jgi:hypothetical protein